MKRRHVLFTLAMVTTMLVSSFNIAIAAEPSATAMIPVSCVGKNTTESFRYELQQASREHQVVKSDALCLSDGNSGTFEVIYDYPGTYHYTIQQEKGTDAKTTYDDTVYQVDVYVTEDAEGRMFALPIIYEQGQDGKKAEVQYVNTKQKVTPPWTHISRPNTGDMASITLYSAVLIGSALVLVIVVILRRRAKEHEE